MPRTLILWSEELVVNKRKPSTFKSVFGYIFSKKNLRCLNQLLNPVLSAERLFRQVQQPKADILAETNTKKLRTYPTNRKDNWIGTSAVPSLPNSYVGSEQVQDSPPGPSPFLATPISTIVEQNRLYNLFWSFWPCFNKQGIYCTVAPRPSLCPSNYDLLFLNFEF